jgi:hypothetical protein
MDLALQSQRTTKQQPIGENKYVLAWHHQPASIYQISSTGESESEQTMDGRKERHLMLLDILSWGLFSPIHIESRGLLNAKRAETEAQSRHECPPKDAADHGDSAVGRAGTMACQ